MFPYMPSETPYPQTLQETVLYFADPDRALVCMVAIKWPSGPVCPKSGAD
jgi:hypothetical protein